MSVADPLLLRYTEELADWFGESETVAMLAAYPKLTAWRAAMKSHANVSAFLKSAHRLPSPADKATGEKYVAEVQVSLAF